MIAEKTSDRRTMFSGVATEKLCPDCRSILREVGRVNENNISFIWYECSKTECGGHWLERRIAAIKTIDNDKTQQAIQIERPIIDKT